ncbi:7-cyano-7-deazaguanine synthase QueC [candidate division WOR-1 bacterium RIFOXYB2_FULL_48_7]|uniref:7-cyano-7-deazaguanine synthase n=1 Tax=candidate division WOR-1 bacterium RIFOXYB2_FULL_48_7 TaxID=1802583 RepID=A0A1F4T912_UNCSA|nr:MAG: 7-cyano-7-deazaguanine synthase QueC [candidate division WOR-1 bacterium RIFOXYB2_FULL_48_7]
MPQAIVLLSGGLDSTTTLYYAIDKGYDCRALIFDYGQRHRREIRHAVAVARRVKVPYHLLKINLPWKGSALLDPNSRLPITSHKKIGKKIPATYVPARNTIFLSFALSFAEAVGAEAIFIGANAVDFSGYPDCRPTYYRAYEKVIKQGLKSNKIKIITPLIKLTKTQIIKLGRKLGAPLEETWSCYAGGKKPCGVCESCRLRNMGFSAIM